MGGGLLLKSDFFPYNASYPKELEIGSNVFIKNVDELTGIASFSDYVKNII